MTKYLLLIPIVFLAACTRTAQDPSIEVRMQNPLFAERYSEALVDRMTEFTIQNDPILEDASKKSVIDATREEWLEKAREAREKQQEGKKGEFIGVSEYARGEALILGGTTLYLSTTFETDPGPDLRIYVTNVIDPRDSEFPDETSADLGHLTSPYGAQSYIISKEERETYRTVVLFDPSLERIYGFAQLN